MPRLGNTGLSQPVNAGWHTIARATVMYRPATNSERPVQDSGFDAGGGTSVVLPWLTPVDPAHWGGTGGIDIRMAAYVVQNEYSLGGGFTYTLQIARPLTIGASGGAQPSNPAPITAWSHLLTDVARAGPGVGQSDQFVTNSFNLPAGSPRAIGATFTASQGIAINGSLWFALALQVSPTG